MYEVLYAIALIVSNVPPTEADLAHLHQSSVVTAGMSMELVTYQSYSFRQTGGGVATYEAVEYFQDLYQESLVLPPFAEVQAFTYKRLEIFDIISTNTRFRQDLDLLEIVYQSRPAPLALIKLAQQESQLIRNVWYDTSDFGCDYYPKMIRRRSLARHKICLDEYRKFMLDSYGIKGTDLPVLPAPIPLWFRGFIDKQ